MVSVVTVLLFLSCVAFPILVHYSPGLQRYLIFRHTSLPGLLFFCKLYLLLHFTFLFLMYLHVKVGSLKLLLYELVKIWNLMVHESQFFCSYISTVFSWLVTTPFSGWEKKNSKNRGSEQTRELQLARNSQLLSSNRGWHISRNMVSLFSLMLMFVLTISETQTRQGTSCSDNFCFSQRKWKFTVVLLSLLPFYDQLKKHKFSNLKFENTHYIHLFLSYLQAYLARVFDVFGTRRQVRGKNEMVWGKFNEG